MMKDKKKIAVFFGGCSTEYEVSLQSAAAVIAHIDTEKYETVFIGLDGKTGEWLWYRGTPELIEKDRWRREGACVPVYPAMERRVSGFVYWEAQGMKTISVDAALPVLHGKNGEDGTLQGVLELAGIPVIGCGLLSSALCMDKELAHRIARMEGIRTAESLTVQKPYNGEKLKLEAQKIGYPLFVKPVKSGSSFGITKVSAQEQLLPAVEAAFDHDDRVVLEQEIRGFEVGCAICGAEELFIGAVDEIELSDGFFDYTEKYTLKTSKIHVPARISGEKAEEIKRTAAVLYRALGCSGFARVDMFLTPEGELYFNEINTIPGFTTHSRYPGMMKAAGISFAELVERILETV